MRLLRGAAVALAAVIALSGCQKEPPTTAQGWAEAIPEIRDDEAKSHAAAQLRDTGLAQLRAGEDLSALTPQLVALLEDDAVAREAAAVLLGEIGDASAAEPLVNALDFSAAVADKEASRANGKIAEALGKLKAKEGTQALLKLAKSPDQFTALAAVESLGKIGDPRSVEPLMKLATSDTLDPFISRNAIEALGEIGDPKAMPALIQMLFRERQGVSFYREASFAVFQVGQDATKDLIGILQGQNEELMQWADSKGIMEAAVFAKAAQVLGDLADPDAVPALIKRLNYKSDFAEMQLLPRMMSAEALGRIRAKAAVAPISRLLDETEANARGVYGRSLVLIGDPRGADALARASENGPYDAREEAQWAFARLAGKGQLARYDAISKRNASLDSCVKFFRDGYECYTKMSECVTEWKKACEPRLDTYAKRTPKYRPMLEAAEACGQDVDCWIGKLDDANGRVREKAGWELGRLGDQKAIDPLLKAVAGDDLEARFAMLHALDTLVFGDDLVPHDTATAQKVAARLNEILETEAGKVHTVRINEDTKRLALKIQRAMRKTN